MKKFMLFLTFSALLYSFSLKSYAHKSYTYNFYPFMAQSYIWSPSILDNGDGVSYMECPKCHQDHWELRVIIGYPYYIYVCLECGHVELHDPNVH